MLVLYDSFVIDLLVIGKWRPSFMHIPQDMTLDKLWVHVKRTFILGWILITPLTVGSTVIFTCLY